MYMERADWAYHRFESMCIRFSSLSGLGQSWAKTTKLRRCNDNLKQKATVNIQSSCNDINWTFLEINIGFKNDDEFIFSFSINYIYQQ